MTSTVRSNQTALLVVLVLLLFAVDVIHAQGPSVPQVSVPPSSLTPYRPPALALVQPAAGGSVPQDRPTVVFRFAPGEPHDPVDVGTFVVTVDGHDRTALFQVTSGEAWGSLASTQVGAQAPIATGSHQVLARVCSTRGTCTETSATVVVVASAAAVDEATHRKRSLVNTLLDIARKLLNP